MAAAGALAGAAVEGEPGAVAAALAGGEAGAAAATLVGGEPGAAGVALAGVGDDGEALAEVAEEPGAGFVTDGALVIGGGLCTGGFVTEADFWTGPGF